MGMMMIEPLKVSRIWPLGINGKKFLCKDMPYIGPAETKAQHENPEDRETVGSQFGQIQGRVERDLERQGLIYEQSETVPMSLTFVSFYKTALSFSICCILFVL